MNASVHIQPAQELRIVPLGTPVPDLEVEYKVSVANPRHAMDEISVRLLAARQMVEVVDSELYDEVLDNIDPDAPRAKYRAERIAALIDSHIRDLQEIKAIVDETHSAFLAERRQSREAKGKGAGRPVDASRERAWDAALIAYRHSAAATEAAEGDDATDAAASVQHEKLNTLSHTRVPHLDALREKVRIMRSELGEKEYEIFSQLLADIDHLN